MRAVALVLGLAGCDTIFLAENAVPPEDVSMLPFDTPIALAALNTAGEEDRPTLTDDLLEIYFHHERAIWTSRRASTQAPFEPPVRVTELAGGYETIRACVAGDGLRIYMSRRADASEPALIHVATRATRETAWSTPTPLAELASMFPDGDELCGWESADRRSMLISTTFFATQDIVRVDRTTADGPFTSFMPIADFNTDLREGAPWANEDATLVVFDRRDGTSITLHQGTLQGARYAVRPLVELQIPGMVGSPWLSKDGRTIVFVHDDDLWMATR